jgi:glutamate synthase (NADPH/NADH) small chain
MRPEQPKDLRFGNTGRSNFPEVSMSIAIIPDDPQIRERFREIHPPLAPQAAVVEAHRCLNCFDAPCTAACPTHIDVPGFIKRIASGNVRGAARRILDANVLGGSCARACPVELLCEGACVMHRYNREPIQIALLQRHAMDVFHASGEDLLTAPPQRRDLRVVCIGAGPASLACAAELRRHGASVTIVDRRSLPGGLNTYGVAEYKLRAAESLRETELIRRMGVEFRFEVAIDDAEQLEKLESEFDIIFLGVGLGAMQRLDIPGEDHEAVINALELIASYKTARLRHVEGTVVVVGGGNTAIDAANAARRLGAGTVYILYRRGESDMAVQVQQVGVTLVHVPGSQSAISCNMVVPAIGQSPLTSLLQQFRHVEVHEGRLVADPATCRTGNARYYAGGDCVNGGREVVDAVADGKRAALAMLAQTETGHD